MKSVKIINNNSGFDCGGCFFDSSGKGCNATKEALQIGDCDIDTIFIEVERMLLPEEDCERIQEILKNDRTIKQKAYEIEGYYKSKIPYNRNRGTDQKQPAMHFMAIQVELLKRGDDLTPLEIEL